MSILPAGVKNYTAETKICMQPDHRHKDNHVDILAFRFRGHDVVIESERWSLIYNVHVDDRLRGQELNAAQLDRFLEGLQ